MKEWQNNGIDTICEYLAKKCATILCNLLTRNKPLKGKYIAEL